MRFNRQTLLLGIVGLSSPFFPPTVQNLAADAASPFALYISDLTDDSITEPSNPFQTSTPSSSENQAGGNQKETSIPATPKTPRFNLFAPPAEGELEDEVIIDLSSPTFEDGVLSTTTGGTLTGPGIRMQARSITYTRRLDRDPPELTVIGDGDLMVLYQGNVFVAQRIEYDFLNRTGYLYNARTEMDKWFLGGRVVELRADGSFYIEKGYITSCEGENADWDITASKVHIKKGDDLSANKLKVRLFKVPVFWVPSLNTKIKDIFNQPLKYKVQVGGGTRVSVRYPFLLQSRTKASAIVEYRLKRGFGGALEARHVSDNEQRTIFSRNFVGYDTSRDKPDNRLRYRFAGQYNDWIYLDKIQVLLNYDRLSDSSVINDYRDDQFVLRTSARSDLIFRRQEQQWIWDIHTRLRINNFQTVNQLLPLASVFYRPLSLEIGKVRLVSSNSMSLGYLDYEFAHGISGVNDFNSTRAQMNTTLMAPTRIGAWTVTPGLGFTGLFFGNGMNDQDHTFHPITRAQLDVRARYFKLYGKKKHTFEPYARYNYVKASLNRFNDQFIFNIHDVYVPLNMVRVGFRQSLLQKTPQRIIRPFHLDVYGHLFFDTPSIPRTVPNLYADLDWRPKPYISAVSQLGWNLETNEVGRYNQRLDWTISEDIAYGIEYRYRDAYDWRKADSNNFSLESFRSHSDLLTSPLSDRRSTLLTRTYWRVHPTVALKLYTRMGWMRETEPSYFEWKIEAHTILRCTWIVRGFFEWTEDDKRFGVGLNFARRGAKRREAFRQLRNDW